MARTTKLGLNLALQGFAPMRRAIAEAWSKLDADAAGRDPIVTTFTGTTGAPTAAMFNRNAEAVIVCSNGSAVLLTMVDAQNDLLPVGAKMFIHQGTGAVTLAVTGNTVTARGVVAGARIATAIKTAVDTWIVQYPALSA